MEKVGQTGYKNNRYYSQLLSKKQNDTYHKTNKKSDK